MIRHLVQTFFDGSPSRAVAALLDFLDFKLSAEDAVRLKKLDLPLPKAAPRSPLPQWIGIVWAAGFKCEAV